MAAASASLLHLATPTPTRSTHLSVRLPTSQLRIATAQPPRAYKVTIEHGGESRVVEVEKDETILSRALDEGLDVPHDCKLGVCMTCPARLVPGWWTRATACSATTSSRRAYCELSPLSVANDASVLKLKH
ncbi:unnamed protein product [Miscanthus lutarioriparius]|uniref:2Fe-2S ferredoxin-type domain-containing protein n=1 Tax=Miscanthus lutarioriparius TaxID=422564 RepID=A0A811N161_9POAL|nr:unnamed protein product [Miscanthus lutarioriparius]